MSGVVRHINVILRQVLPWGALSLNAVPVYAASSDNQGGFTFGLEAAKQRAQQAGLSTVSGQTAIENVIVFILGLVGIVAVLAVILGGVMYIISIGDESKAERAKKIILYAVIGLIVVGLSLTIVNFVIGLV